MLFQTRDNVSLWLQIIAVALSIAILVTGGLMIFWSWYFGRIGDGQYIPNQGTNIGSGTIIEEPNDPDLEDPSVSDEPAGPTGDIIHPSALSSLKSNLKNWMSNGDPVRSNDVTNILLIGMDNTDLSKNSRADAMVIFSINHKTKTITLASLLRDQYCYLIHNNVGSFQKLHHANSLWGPAAQIQMIERYYKVIIDNYAIVNFASLPKVIDAVGGVEVDLTSAESEYLRNTCGFKHLTTGNNTLSGDEALIYMRIRKGNTGGDTARVNRQQTVIKQMLAKAKGYGITTMISVVNSVIPYIRTGLSSTDILGYATTALSDGWFNYEIKQVTLPDGDCSKGFTNSEDNLWYWKVDFPVAAQKLQLALYGQTNIDLDPGRKSWI